MIEHGVEEEEAPSNVTVHYDVGPGHPEYDPDAHLDFAWQELRAKRNNHLRKVDIYQGVILYNTLTEEQQTELATYRQALLDLPNDYDDPYEAMQNVPTMPSWLN